jgi:dienelactone hydrolase
MVKTTLEQARSSHPQHKIIVTGHSMGAGIAALAAPQLLDMGINSTLYTYGQPRGGNKAFADWVDKNMPTTYRVTYKDDGICQAPPASKGYRHHKTEYWVTDPPSATNTFTCEGQEDSVS